jgi:2-succinyl-5-enolpyruvyl-6-hydroxy-3-cyclohexene-1-carboxylate synthase
MARDLQQVSDDAAGFGTSTVLTDLAASVPGICADLGVRDAVISPGSRSALLTVAFAREPRVACHVIVDERSAAYVAIGIAQQTERPVVLVCTSGTAALNYGPAVAEAFFLNIPLVVCTADRPPEWIGQNDGQAIQQDNLYGPHTKRCYTLPVDDSHPDARWHFLRDVSYAINLSIEDPPGPVQINVPIREPFYQKISRSVDTTQHPGRAIVELKSRPTLSDEQWQSLVAQINRVDTLVVLVGQLDYSESFREKLTELAGRPNWVILGDILSNTHGTGTLNHVDGIFSAVEDGLRQMLRPDLLITLGKSVLSKNVKSFFRQCRVPKHWHIQPAGQVADTLQSLGTIIRADAAEFLDQLSARLDEARHREPSDTRARWQALDAMSREVLSSFLSEKKALGEFEAVAQLLAQLPGDCDLHLANSMAVRYANLVGLCGNEKTRVYGNRGTAGIDGCLSTMIGHAYKTDRLQVLLIGDLAFFYDRNALANDVPPNVRIVLINNHGGGIFELIDGPADLPELMKYFVTPHGMTAEHTCAEFGLDYRVHDSRDGLLGCVGSFLKSGGRASVLEVETDREANRKSFARYRRLLSEKSKCIV